MTRCQQLRELINRRQDLAMPGRAVLLVTWRGLGLLALALFVMGCATPVSSRSPGSDTGRTRCFSQPGRGESYSSDRPLFFLFCIESP